MLFMAPTYASYGLKNYYSRETCSLLFLPYSRITEESSSEASTMGETPALTETSSLGEPSTMSEAAGSPE